MIFRTRLNAVVLLSYFYRALLIGLMAAFACAYIPTTTTSYASKDICGGAKGYCQAQPKTIQMRSYGIPFTVRSTQSNPADGLEPLESKDNGMFYVNLLAFTALFMGVLIADMNRRRRENTGD